MPHDVRAKAAGTGGRGCGCGKIVRQVMTRANCPDLQLPPHFAVSPAMTAGKGAFAFSSLNFSCFSLVAKNFVGSSASANGNCFRGRTFLHKVWIPSSDFAYSCANCAFKSESSRSGLSLWRAPESGGFRVETSRA
jgi:hypothetical protein